MKCFLNPLRLPAAALGAVFLAPFQGWATPIISEFMASNLTVLEDEDGDASDWIEFYNPGDTTYSLSGHFLTDDRRNLRKWKVPGSLNVDPGGYGLLFASGKNRGGLFASVYHTNFELTEDGEYLALVAADGETILSEFSNRYPKQRTGLSFGIGQNEDGGTEWRYFENPTPEAANGEGRVDLPPQVADTKFNFGRGFYEEPITVEITTATEGATIYYSTDGSDPGPGSVFVPGKMYTEPLEISGTTMLRARAYKDGLEPTNIDTHTYLFIDSVLQQPDEPEGLPDRWNGQPAHYGISEDITEGDYSDEIKDAFLALPSLSIVTEEDNIWGSQGLYLNTTRRAPSGSGAEFPYEFEVSAELINPDGSEGFQIQAGLRAQGGASRNADRSAKHAMSLRFRREYGEGRLDYPIIKSSPQQSYNAIHLRARYNNSWIHSNSGQRDRAQYIRDQWARDALIEMGTISGGHGDYHHVYLNGLYWGIFVVQERMDNSHYADYYGGRSDELDSINGGRATDGDLQSFNAMKDAARDRDWEEIQKRLDVDNYIDWHISQRFGGNQDWKNDGNWKAAGGGPNNQPWRFYNWDTERILESVTQNGVGPSQDPSGIFNSLDDIPEFMVRFGDRVHKHLFNDGALTVERNIARYQRRAGELEVAVVAESARWGHQRRGTPYARDDEWDAERERILEDYFPDRTDNVIENFQAAGLYPNILGVDLNQFGGRVDEGFELKLSSEGTSIFNPGKLYYTLDGSDPMAPDGELNDSAVEYSSPIELTESVVFKARTRSARDEWSALTDTFFAVGTTAPSSENLVVSELMYHPGPPTAEESAAGHVSSDDFEYIELLNVGDQPIDLAGSSFSAGIRLGFAAGPDAVLDPGESALLVRDEAAFRFRYGDEPRIRGVFFDGSLDNDSERLTLVGEDGAEILSLDYSDGGSWPQTADGTGFSLVLADPTGGVDLDRGSSWRASAEVGGSPGAEDPSISFDVVINEVLTNSAAPQVDAIELLNLGDQMVDVSHWFLTDDANEPNKYALPEGSTIPPGGYLVVEEDNDDDPENNDSLPAEYFGSAFGLSSRGDSVHLFSANAAGQLTGYNDGFSFGAADEGVTFGRHVDSQGRVEYPAMGAPSLGAANPAPAVGNVVISEIMYHSTHILGENGDAGEYVELVNRSSQEIDLSGWRLSGISFDFPAGAKIAPGGVALVSRVGAADFAQWYSDVPQSVTVFGPYGGRLSNDGERLTLERPGETYLDGDTEKTTLVAEDSVRYNDAEPWPANADGLGYALERQDLAAYADEVNNWKSSAAEQGSPGIADVSVDPDPTGTTFAQWQEGVFSPDQLADDAISGALADPDDDGLANRLEFALGSSPLEADTNPIAVSREGDVVALTYERRRRRDLEGLAIAIELSNDLSVWNVAVNSAAETSVQDIAGTDRERVIIELSLDGVQRYVRLTVD